MVLYDKEGREINVPHYIDQKERLASGELFTQKPVKKAPAKKKTVKKDS